MPEIHIQTSVRCCGAMHSTPFCPSCGKGLAMELPLASLLCHVTNHAGQQGRLLAKSQHDDYGYDRQKRSADKWESWRVALSEVVNPVKDKPDV